MTPREALRARIGEAVEQAIYNFLYGDDMDETRPHQFKEHFVDAVEPLLAAERAAEAEACSEAIEQADFLLKHENLSAAEAMKICEARAAAWRNY